MARIYSRDEKHYDFKLLSHLVETGQATFFEGPAIYVIKTEDGTVAVRPHQVIFTPDPAPFTLVIEEKVASPMDGYFGQERYDGEDTGPGGVVYDSMLAIAEKFLGANPEGIDPLVIVRKMLDDEGYADLITNEANGVPVSPVDQSQRAATSWVSASEQDEILGYFGI